MATFTTEAIVLKQFDLGEADKIITFYSKEKGKVRAVARGARKARSNITGLVQPFTYCEVKVYRGGSIDRINEIKNKFSFSPLREDLTKMAYATYMAELIEKVGMEDSPSYPLFSLLLTTFHKLLQSDRRKFRLINLVFKIRVLAILGFKPQLESCVYCGNEIELSGRNRLTIAGGGILCQRCVEGSEDDLIDLSGEAVVIFKKILKSGLKISPGLRLSAGAYRQLEYFLKKFMIYHLDISLRSEKFLHSIQDLG